MTIKVNADLFRIVYTTVSTEETRYYLNGVYVQPHEKGALLISTDGHRMIVAHDPEGVCDEAAIVKLPRFALAQCRTPKMLGTKRAIEVTGGSATVAEMTPNAKEKGAFIREAIVTVHKVVVDGTYPDWRRVVPGAWGTLGAPGSINPKYIKAWGEVGVELARLFGGTGAAAIFATDPNSPMLVRFDGRDNVFGIQMPLRSDIRADLPAFVKDPVQTLQAAE